MTATWTTATATAIVTVLLLSCGALAQADKRSAKVYVECIDTHEGELILGQTHNPFSGRDTQAFIVDDINRTVRVVGSNDTWHVVTLNDEVIRISVQITNDHSDSYHEYTISRITGKLSGFIRESGKNGADWKSSESYEGECHQMEATRKF